MSLLQIVRQSSRHAHLGQELHHALSTKIYCEIIGPQESRFNKEISGIPNNIRQTRDSHFLTPIEPLGGLEMENDFPKLIF